MNDERLEVSDDDDQLGARLGAEIYHFNVEATGIADGRPLRVAVHTREGELQAGLDGWTWGGCGYISVLWVRGQDRRRGLGSRLLATAEAEAQQRGCDRVALSTHTFQAPAFYLARGYVECGRTPGYPHGHDQIHLIKQLSHRSGDT